MIITIGSNIMDDQSNNYIIDTVLGSGGFGDVFKAHRVSDGRTVAVKTFRSSFSSTEAHLSFVKETNQSVLMDSENVVKYLFINDGVKFDCLPPYIIMEYTDCGTLRDLFENQNGEQFDSSTLKGFMIQLAKGMKIISEHLVHRDIKPENILNFNGVLKISDFGISKIAQENTNTLSFKGFGTPMYIAPEAWLNEKNTIQMDIYSMGIVFYQLATLSYPYDIPGNGDFKKMHQVFTAKNPLSVNRNLPANLASMIVKMIEKPIQKRFKNWNEILSVLEAEPLPEDEMSSYINTALKNRTKVDLQIQKEAAARIAEANERAERIDLAYSQFQNDVIVPIEEYMKRFNSQYAGRSKLKITNSQPQSYYHRFSSKIVTPSDNRIDIKGEVIFKSDFTRRIETDRLFNPGKYITQNYIPQCDGKNVILWCQVSDENGYGFNILLLENKESLYGDWYLLSNSVSGLSRENRNSPFGFELQELPKEINYLHVTHIYNLELSEYSNDIIFEFINERI